MAEMISVGHYLAQGVRSSLLSDPEGDKIFRLVTNKLDWMLPSGIADTLTWALQENQEGTSDLTRLASRPKPNTRVLLVANTILLHARQK